jgi:hypothetical protein
LFLEKFFDSLSLHLEGRSAAAVFNRETFCRDVNIFGLLDAVVVVSFADSLHLSNNGLLELRVLGDGFVVLWLAVSGSPLFSTFVKGYNHDSATLERGGVDEAGAHERTSSERTFKLLRSNVFALRKLHNHLSTVDDRNGTILVGSSYISTVEPLSIEGVFGNFGESEVTLEHIRPSDLNLTSGVRLVGGEVVHVGDVLQPNFSAPDRASNVTEVGILCISASGRSGGLTEPIAFQKRATEANLEEFHNILVQRSRASNHGLNFTS